MTKIEKILAYSMMVIFLALLWFLLGALFWIAGG